MNCVRRFTVGLLAACCFLLLNTGVSYGVFESPVSQMYSHAHRDDSWMVSLQTMTSSADGVRHGDSKLSNATVLEHFNHSPTSMQMTMTMLDVMKAVTDKTTVMVTVPYILHNMTMETPSGDSHSHSPNGIGDITVSALYTTYRDDTEEFFWITGISLPSGSIDETDDEGNRLSYPMQLGSGTVDLHTGFTLKHRNDTTNFGVNVLGTFRTGMSKNGYRLGDKFEASVWAGRSLFLSFRGTMKLGFSGWSNIHGEDESLDPVHSGINSHHRHTDALNTTQTGGYRSDFSLGLNHAIGGINVGLEAGIPVIQHYPGYVLNQTWWATLGVSAGF